MAQARLDYAETSATDSTYDADGVGSAAGARRRISAIGFPRCATLLVSSSPSMGSVGALPILGCSLPLFLVRSMPNRV